MLLYLLNTIFICFTAGILALLDEPEPELQIFALERLNEILDVFWPEIADSVQKMWVFY